MKRSKPLTRKTPLTSTKGLTRTAFKAASQLTRKPLKPISARKRAERHQDALDAAQGALAFKRRIFGERCVVCGKTEQEAYDATGYGHEAHHGIPKSRLKDLGLRHLVWDPENAVCTCEEPCHRRHTSRHARIPLASLPPRVIGFALKHGLEHELNKEYPA